MKTPQELNKLADRLDTPIQLASVEDVQQAARELRHMAQLRADLHEAAELLRQSARANDGGKSFSILRDSFLAKLKALGLL